MMHKRGRMIFCVLGVSINIVTPSVECLAKPLNGQVPILPQRMLLSLLVLWENKRNTSLFLFKSRRGS